MGISLTQESAMVANFLLDGLKSEASRGQINSALQRLAVPPQTIKLPDLACAQQNKLRAIVLDDVHGYLRRTDTFEKFPEDVQWLSVGINRSQVSNLHYRKDPEWIDRTLGSRLVEDGAQYFKGTPKHPISSQLAALQKQVKNHESIGVLIGLSLRSSFDKVVLLAGHLQATAFCMASDSQQNIELIFGISANAPDYRFW